MRLRFFVNILSILNAVNTLNDLIVICIKQKVDVLLASRNFLIGPNFLGGSA